MQSGQDLLTELFLAARQDSIPKFLAHRTAKLGNVPFASVAQ
jgi:hypothetical protein